MTDQERLRRLAVLLSDAQVLEQDDNPVLAANMTRVVALLHEARQLLDADYMTLKV